MTLPSKLYAGDAWTITHTDATLPAGAQLKLHVNSPAFQFTSDFATGTAGVFTFALPGVITADFAPSTYMLSLTATVAGARRTLISGHVLTVDPDPATASSFSYARRLVYALEALLEGRVTSSHAAYVSMTFEGRAITQMAPAEMHRALRLARDELATELRAEQMAKGMGNKGNKLKVRFR